MKNMCLKMYATLLQLYFKKSIIGIIFISLFSSAPPLVAANEKKTVRVAMSITPLSSPLIIAQAKGFFKEFGLNIDIKQVKGGHLAFKSLMAGEVDIATSSEAVVMFNSFKRNDFSLFCTFVTSDNDVKILARSDSGINTISDFKGKKIGTILGTSAHFFLSQSLLISGVSEGEVKVFNLKPHEAKKTLASKKLDAIVAWEPYAYLAKKELGDKVKIIEHDRVYIETFNAITLRQYADRNTDKLSRFTQALIKATDYIKQHNEESQHIVANVLNKDLDVIKNTWSDYTFSVGLNQWLLTSMEAEARWAIEHKFLSVKDIPNYINFINTKPLEKISPESISVFN